jgi:broad specificity phosphatase PhoE
VTSATSAVYLVRHAKALDRYSWTELDELRPLSKAGFRQASALPEHIGRVGFAKLLTSPFTRCVQTFEPLAESDGTPLERVDWLAEGASAGAALDLLLERADRGPVAACTHGDVMLETLARLGTARVPLEGPLDVKKGSTWILTTSEGRVVGGRYLKPPSSAKER